MINGVVGTKPRRIAVIGAGVIGLASAVALRREGHDVTLIDRVLRRARCRRQTGDTIAVVGVRVD